MAPITPQTSTPPHSPFLRRWGGKALAAFAALAAATVLPAGTATAEGPVRVVTSIAPLHSLATALLGDQGQATLLVPPGASPHTYSMKPSDAVALSQADLVLWLGPDMESFMPRLLESLPETVDVTALSRLSGVKLLPLRSGGAWGEGHDHHHDGPTHDEPTHDNQDHDAHDGHQDGHEEGHGDHDHHDHDQAHAGHQDHDIPQTHPADAPIDPHQWLDPMNARLWVATIAGKLVVLDPDNAALYTERADALDQRLAALDQSLTDTFAPVAGKPYLVFHDAYQYMEQRYGLTPVGALSIDPGQPMGARRIAELRAHVRDTGATCIFAEPQFSTALPDVVGEGSPAKVASADPLGQDVPAGPDHYFIAMRSLAQSMVDCLARQ